MRIGYGCVLCYQFLSFCHVFCKINHYYNYNNNCIAPSSISHSRTPTEQPSGPAARPWISRPSSPEQLAPSRNAALRRYYHFHWWRKDNIQNLLSKFFPRSKNGTGSLYFSHSISFKIIQLTKHCRFLLRIISQKSSIIPLLDFFYARSINKVLLEYSCFHRKLYVWTVKFVSTTFQNG